MPERNYRNLKVWTAAHALTVRMYFVTKTFPDDERFGLTSQIRRSLASVGANIAEGACRSSKPAFAHYIELAYSSAGEADQHLVLARDVGLLDDRTYDEVFDALAELRRMLAALRRSLRS